MRKYNCTILYELYFKYDASAKVLRWTDALLDVNKDFVEQLKAVRSFM